MTDQRLSAAEARESVSMIQANYGNGALAETLLRDWFDFMGGQPGEVVLVENGSPWEDQRPLFEATRNGAITKYLAVRPGAPDVGRHQAYVGELSAAALATRPLVLLYHFDTLVLQRGHDDWLAEACAILERPDRYAVGGSFNAAAMAEPQDDHYFLSKKLSGNFALLPRSTYQRTWLSVAEEFIRSGYRVGHPLDDSRRRFLMEVGFEHALDTGSWFTAVRREDPDWTVFHTNCNGEALMAARDRFRRREGLDGFMNRGAERMTAENEYVQRHYGRAIAAPKPAQGLRSAFGRSALGVPYRRLKHALVPPPVVSEPPDIGETTAPDRDALARTSVVVTLDVGASELEDALRAFAAGLGDRRPGQLVLIAPSGSADAERLWDLHVSGAFDKLLLSRDFDPALGLDARHLVEHGIFALAHYPILAVSKASALGELAAALRDEAGAEGASTPLPTLLDGSAWKGHWVVGRRSRLAEALQPGVSDCVALGSRANEAPWHGHRGEA